MTRFSSVEAHFLKPIGCRFRNTHRWERVDPGKSISQNIKLQLPTPNNLMQSVPALLFRDFVTDLHNYLAILAAVAIKFWSPKGNPAFTGLPATCNPKYLSVLVEAGFVERRVSLTEN